MTIVGLACGGDRQQSTSAETSAATSASPDTIEVTMEDFAYSPDTLTVPVGHDVTLAFTNTGSVEHYFVVGDTITTGRDGFEQNLFSGVSIEKNKQAEGHEGDDEEHEEEEEHHANEFELSPGGSGTMTFTLPPSKAGTYTIACFETTGGKKHYEMGMKGTLTVSPAPDN